MVPGGRHRAERARGGARPPRRRERVGARSLSLSLSHTPPPTHSPPPPTGGRARERRVGRGGGGGAGWRPFRGAEPLSRQPGQARRGQHGWVLGGRALLAGPAGACHARQEPPPGVPRGSAPRTLHVGPHLRLGPPSQPRRCRPAPLSRRRAHTVRPSLTHSLTHTHSHSLSHTLSLSHSLILSLTHTHSHSLSLSLSLSWMVAGSRRRKGRRTSPTPRPSRPRSCAAPPPLCGNVHEL